MRIAIVNDMAMAVEALRRVLRTQPRVEIAWVARDGREAVEKCETDVPDLILMDLIMPVMDGVEATRRIMAQTPCAILVVTASVEGNASKVFDAMSWGALDAVNTPSLGSPDDARRILEKIARIGSLIGRRTVETRPILSATVELPPPGELPSLIAIGCSTGGPAALAKVLKVLPADFPAAIVVVQHVDEQFAPGFASWVDSQTELAVRVARKGESPEPGIVSIAASNDHLVLTSARTFDYRPDPKDNPYRPSADVFFHACAARWDEKGIAVALTGMGRDGAEGMLELRKKGWHTIAQDQETSLIFGMPKACIEVGAAVEILPLLRIGPTLLERMGMMV